MNSAYPTLPLEELLFVPLKNGLTRPKSVRGRGYPMVNMGELFAYERIDENVSMDLVPMSECEAKSFSVLKGDLLFARQSLVLSGAGKCSYIKNLKQTTTFESHIIRARIDQSKASPLFYYYFFRSPQGKQTILSIVEQVAAAGIRGSDLKRLQVPVPPLPEQRSIAAILSALDDKIELNRQMNKTLKEMAQAIFKEWFVDFGPFRDGGMQDSELGPIPVGWEIGKAEDFFDISIGKTPPRKEAQWFSTNDNDIKWVSISDMGRSGLFILNTSEYLTQEAIDKHHVKIVPANTVLLSFKLTVGRVSITSQEMTTNEAIAHFNTNMGNVNEFLFYYLKNFNFDSLGNTSSIANAVNSKVIKAMPILMPDEAILEAYHVLISSFFAEIKRNQEENCTLTAIRDTLLPKLMSGELRVPVSDNAG